MGITYRSLLRAALSSVFKVMSKNHHSGMLSKLGRCSRKNSKVFKNILDKITLEDKRDIWIEKSPQHLFFIRHIEKYIPDSKFIHLIRSGEDTIASLYRCGKDYRSHNDWYFNQDLDACINQWINCIKESKRYMDKSNHIFVQYEDIIDNTENTIEKICSFIGVKFEKDMLSRYADQKNNLIYGKESWKVDDFCSSIRSKPKKGFNTIFNNQQKEHILKRISEVNLSDFRKIRQAIQ